MKNVTCFTTCITTLMLIIMVIIETKISISSAYCINFSSIAATNRKLTKPWHRFKSNDHHATTLTRFYSNKNNRDADDGEHDEEEAYINAMKEAAKDPVRFQEFVAEQQRRRRRRTEEEEKEDTDEVSPGKKKGYVPIEQWDDERSKVDAKISWEEKVRFDGRRFGDGFQQNEILRKNLKSW